MGGSLVEELRTLNRDPAFAGNGRNAAELADLLRNARADEAEQHVRHMEALARSLADQYRGDQVFYYDFKNTL